MNEDIFARIEELEERRFLINMKDHWSNDDSRMYSELGEEIRRLKELLREV